MLKPRNTVKRTQNRPVLFTNYVQQAYKVWSSLCYSFGSYMAYIYLRSWGLHTYTRCPYHIRTPQKGDVTRTNELTNGHQGLRYRGSSTPLKIYAAHRFLSLFEMKSSVRGESQPPKPFLLQSNLI